MSRLWWKVFCVGLALGWTVPSFAADALKQLLQQLMAVPKIETAAGVTAKVLVPPGSFYDPFDLYSRGTILWVSDDGKEEGEKGGQIFSVDAKGRVSTTVGLGKLLPPIALDVAPPGFGAFAGQIFTVAFARPDAEAGFLVPNVIQRINPDTRAVTNACTLPKNAAGQDGAGGFFLRFGPDGSDFAGKLFITAATNQTLYAMTPDGACSPFVSIDIQKWGYPTGLTFTPDGKTMLVGTAQPATGDPAGPPKKGAGKIIQISSAGVVAENPFVMGLDQPCGMLFAPKGFGPYGGQLLVVDSGDFHSPVPMTQPVKRDGRLYGVTASGELTVIASGFANPTGVAFLGNRLVVSDINGDFHVGQRELPDGFLVAIDAK